MIKDNHNCFYQCRKLFHTERKGFYLLCFFQVEKKKKKKDDFEMAYFLFHMIGS